MDFNAELKDFRNFCMEPGWWDPDTPAIKEIVFQRAEALFPYIPTNYDMSACPDASIQWEWSDNRKNELWVIIEVYENYYSLSIKNYNFMEVDFDKFVKELQYRLPQYNKELYEKQPKRQKRTQVKRI